MRFHVKIALVFIPVILLASLFVLYPREGPIIESGEFPEFSFTLTDNGDNDYVGVKFISNGTGFYELPVPLSFQWVEIYIWPKENPSEFYKLELPPENLYPGENTTVFANVDVVEAGNVYKVSIDPGGKAFVYEVVAG